MTTTSLRMMDCPYCGRTFEIERGADAIVKRHILFEHDDSDEPSGATGARTSNHD